MQIGKSLVAVLATVGFTLAGIPAVPMAHAGRLAPQPSKTTTSVQARVADIFKVVFQGGARANVAVVGDGSTDLDVFVYDAKGVEVAKDVGPTDNCLASWVPPLTGTFTIRVVNRGWVSNRYVMETN